MKLNAEKTGTVRFAFILLSLLINTSLSSSSNYFKIFGLQSSNSYSDPCYAEISSSSNHVKPRKCIPDFVNAAFGREMVASHTCGVKLPSKMCFLSDGIGVGILHASLTSHPLQSTQLQSQSSEWKNVGSGRPQSQSPISTATTPSSLLKPPDLLESTKLFGEMDFSQEKDDEDVEDPLIGVLGEESPTPADPADSPAELSPTTTPQPRKMSKKESRRGNRRKSKGRQRSPRSLSMVNLRSNKLLPTCHICDANNPKKAHPTTFMTDLNNPNNLTCWESNPFALDGDNVTLTLSLGKKYELTYVSLQFCGGVKPVSP